MKKPKCNWQTDNVKTVLYVYLHNTVCGEKEVEVGYKKKSHRIFTWFNLNNMIKIFVNKL